MSSQKIISYFTGNSVTTNEASAHSLFEKSSFGERKEDKVIYSLYEAFYLSENNSMSILNSKGKEITLKDLLNKFRKIDKKFNIKYIVFKDLREKGYVVKTALKFGAEFRVYDKGVKPGRNRKVHGKEHEHAKWIVYTDFESSKISWHEFSAKNRVAHSTKKNLLLAIVDEENSVTYYEVSWVRT